MIHTSRAAIVRFACSATLRGATDVADPGGGDAYKHSDGSEEVEKHDCNSLIANFVFNLFCE